MRGSDVLEAVASNFGTSVDELVGRRRTARACTARFTAALLLREQLAWSYQRIGRLLGDRDHSTIHHAVQVAYGWRLDRPHYAARLEELADLLHRSPAA